MNAEDRKIVESIAKTTQETRNIVSSLSVSLIGKSNGTTVDEKGGRLGRLEAFVWWLFCGILTALASVGYMIIDKWIHKGG